ncbi:MAG: hypothetical protein GY841_16320 [FCB group bacterium]|nr:hypothetical protein [FCB group bacterium]
MNIQQYFPSFFEGFKAENVEFSTVEELKEIPWVKKWVEDEQFSHLAKWGTALMAAMRAKDAAGQNLIFVVGFIENPDDCDLPEWGEK